MELYLYSPKTPSWRGAELKKSTGTTLPLQWTLPCVHYVFDKHNDLGVGSSPIFRRLVVIILTDFALFFLF
jgi:hypothetical protein